MRPARSRTRRGLAPAPVALASLALLVAGCGGGGGGGGPTALEAASESQVEFSSFQLANNARAANGVQPPLTLEQVVSAVARAHSEAMRDLGFFSHNGEDGSLRSRLRAAGVEFGGAGENLAMVTSSGDPAVAAHNEFLASQAHLDVMLDRRFEVVGVGVARLGDTYWLTQIYISP